MNPPRSPGARRSPTLLIAASLALAGCEAPSTTAVDTATAKPRESNGKGHPDALPYKVNRPFVVSFDDPSFSEVNKRGDIRYAKVLDKDRNVLGYWIPHSTVSNKPRRSKTRVTTVLVATLLSKEQMKEHNIIVNDDEEPAGKNQVGEAKKNDPLPKDGVDRGTGTIIVLTTDPPTTPVDIPVDPIDPTDPLDPCPM